MSYRKVGSLVVAVLVVAFAGVGCSNDDGTTDEEDTGVVDAGDEDADGRDGTDEADAVEDGGGDEEDGTVEEDATDGGGIDDGGQDGGQDTGTMIAEVSCPDSPDLEVSIVGGVAGSFDPSSITPTVGDVVEWTNEGSTQHTVTHATTGETVVFDSGQLNEGESYCLQFMEARDWNYECTLHPAMTGTITVQE